MNPKYGNDPGVTFYTHISDQYAPFHTKVINAAVRDATRVLDGLLYHESDLRIEEHYTDTAGFTDHVFGLCHLLGFRFAPRIRDLADKRLYVPGRSAEWPALSPLIGGSINTRLIEQQLDEVLRLAASIQQGTVTASLILRKLGAYPRQNSLALALREIGRMERTFYTLAWLEDPALRRRVTAGLNKGEARNSLARAVFFNRLGEIRDRSFENQRQRNSKNGPALASRGATAVLNFSAVTPNDLLHDPKTKPVSVRLAALKRFEHRLSHGCGDSGTVVSDGYDGDGMLGRYSDMQASREG